MSAATHHEIKFPLEVVEVGERSVNVTDADGYDIAHDIEPEHAAFIVKACNTHDVLKAEIAELRECGQAAADRADDNQRKIDALEAENCALLGINALLRNFAITVQRSGLAKLALSHRAEAVLAEVDRLERAAIARGEGGDV